LDIFPPEIKLIDQIQGMIDLTVYP
jgi:hypothetical protein